MFTGVLLAYMEIKKDGEIAVLNQFLADLLGCDAADVYDRLEELLNQILPKKALHEYGMKPEDIGKFTESVMTTQAVSYTHLDVYKRQVEEGDTPEILQRRVMEQAEWVILPKAINMIANGQ